MTKREQIERRNDSRGSGRDRELFNLKRFIPVVLSILPVMALTGCKPTIGSQFDKFDSNNHDKTEMNLDDLSNLNKAEKKLPIPDLENPNIAANRILASLNNPNVPNAIKKEIKRRFELISIRYTDTSNLNSPNPVKTLYYLTYKIPSVYYSPSEDRLYLNGLPIINKGRVNPSSQLSSINFNKLRSHFIPVENYPVPSDYNQPVEFHTIASDANNQIKPNTSWEISASIGADRTKDTHIANITHDLDGNYLVLRKNVQFNVNGNVSNSTIVQHINSNLVITRQTANSVRLYFTDQDSNSTDASTAMATIARNNQKEISTLYKKFNSKK
jgi:hypothetical protein